jgi:hypothetical protein
MNANDIGQLAMGLMESLDGVAQEHNITEPKVAHAVIVVAYTANLIETGETYRAIRFRASSADFWTTRGVLMEAAEMSSLGALR